MAEFTEHYHLKKPEDAEYYDVADFNRNMDIIDKALAQSAGGAEAADKIGEPADTVPETVFGKLNGYISPDGKGVRIIKSIQRVTYRLAANTSGGRVDINKVDQTRCIALLDRLYDSGGCSSINYTIFSSSVSFSHLINSGGLSLSVALWLIEFY